MRKTKTFLINLLSGKNVRLYKSEVCGVSEQLNIEGGVDTIVFMKSNYSYITSLSKSEIEKRAGL